MYDDSDHDQTYEPPGKKGEKEKEKSSKEKKGEGKKKKSSKDTAKTTWHGRPSSRATTSQTQTTPPGTPISTDPSADPSREDLLQALQSMYEHTAKVLVGITHKNCLFVSVLTNPDHVLFPIAGQAWWK